MAPINRKNLTALAHSILGERVDRATAALPQTAAGALFNVEGGRILLTAIVGEVTTVIQTQANNTKLQSNPDAGTTSDICAVLDITAKEVGTLFSISGTVGDALLAGSSGAVRAQTAPVIVAPGAIELSCAASNTGAVKWSMFYIPLDDAAYVEAA